MKLNINKIFSGILLFLIIVNILIIFNLDYFYVRTILSLIFLIIIPGLLIMLDSKIRNIGFWEYIVYTIGLSVAFIMFTGLVVNWILPALKITNRPLSLYPILISFDIILLVFTFLSYKRNKDLVLELKFPRLDIINRTLFIVPIIFPVLSILGAVILNNKGPNFLTMLMLGGIAVYVIFIVSFRKKLNQNIYPWAILMMSISLLLMGWLRSWYVSGVDINLEYYIFQLVKANQQWNISLFNNGYNTCLSISILPTVLSSFVKINDQYIFKLIIPLIFSIMPIGVYLFLKRYTQNIFAFVASLFFISQPTFMTWWWIPIRQEISFLFLTLSLLVLFNKNLSYILRNTLFLIFGFSMVVSHYSTSYLAVSLFILTYLLYLVFRKTKDKKFFSKIYKKLNLKENKKLKNDRAHYLNWKIVFSLVVFTFLWNVQFTETSSSFVVFMKKTTQNMGKFFSEDIRSHGTSFSSQWNIFYVQEDPTEILESYSKEIALKYKDDPNIDLYSQDEYGNYKPTVISSEFLPSKISSAIISKIYIFREIIKKLVKIFIIFGVFYLIFTQLKKRKIDPEYITMAFGSLFWMAAVMFLPFASIEYDAMRTYQQVLIILSLPAVLGGLAIFKFLKKENLKTFVVLAVFLFYFLFLTELVPQIIGGTYPSMQLNNFGNGCDELYVHESEIKSATWLFKESRNEDIVYADIRAVNKLHLLTNNNENQMENNIFPFTIDKEAYVYSGYTNTIKKMGFISAKGSVISYNFPTGFLNQNKNKIYNNGESEIFK